MTESNHEHTGRLLIVDDNALNRNLLSRRLKRLGHEVAVAEDGKQALDAIAAKSFDVVLLDVMMPVIDGFEALKMLRRTHDQTALPVIMVTAKNQAEDIIMALDLGANDYVTKPIDFKVVAARVRTQLELKRSVDLIKQLEHNLKLRNIELESANDRMKRDLEMAARVQQSGLPKTLPDIDGIKFAWAYHPCEELGGDSLDIFQLDDEHVGLYVLDVSGHGVPAALLSVALHRQLTPRRDNSCLVTEPGTRTVTPPSLLAVRLNRIFQWHETTSQYFTVCYGHVNAHPRRFCFTGAGHPGPIHLGIDGRTNIHDTPGFPIGIVEEPEYTELALDLQPGERVYLYSDGINEAVNPDGQMYGRKRLAQAIADARDVPLQQSIDRLLEQVHLWRNTEQADDDLSIVAMETG